MKITEEKKIMIDLLKEYADSMPKKPTNYNYYFAPDIPKKVFETLISKFDNHMPINSVIAFFDETVLKSSKAGFVFTVDGFYYRHTGKAMYFAFKDIGDLEVEKDSIKIFYNDLNQNEVEYLLTNSFFDMEVIDYLIRELISIDNTFGQSTQIMSGKVQKTEIPPDVQAKCHGIIHAAAMACGGVGTGLAQIPLSDAVIITPIQIGMVVGIGAVFHINVTEAGAKSIIASAGAAIAGRTVSQLLIGWIPGIGNAINTATAAGITEAIGWIAVKHFYDRTIQESNKGRFEGMKDGFAEASDLYEQKLREQAEDFLSQAKNFKKSKKEYEELLAVYEEYIEKLEKENAAYKTKQEFKNTYNALMLLNRA